MCVCVCVVKTPFAATVCNSATNVIEDTLFFLEMPVPSQEGEQSCICVIEVSIFFSVYDFSIGCWDCYDSVVFCFHFITHLR
jgi:hypothetical protein